MSASSIRRVATIATVTAIVACADSPTVPLPGNAATTNRTPPAAARAIRGSAHLIVRRFDRGGRFGQVVQQEDGNFTAAVRDGRAVGAARFPSGTFDAAALAPDQAARAAGVWARDLAGGGSVRRASRSKGPNIAYDETELRRGGIVKSRIARTWERGANGWQLSEFTATFYDGGTAIASISVSFDRGEATDISNAVAQLGESGPARAPLGGPDLARAPADRGSFSAGGVCQAEEYAAKDALISFESANAALLGCLAGPWVCIAAGINATAAAFKYDNAIDRWNECLAAY